MDGMGWDGMDISQTTRNTRAPGGAKKIVSVMPYLRISLEMPVFLLISSLWYEKVRKRGAPEGSLSHCFEGRHGSGCGCLASEDSQVGLVLLGRVKDVMHPPSRLCAAAGTRKGSWSSSGGSSQGPLLSQMTFLAFSIWERTTGGKSGLILLCRCYATTQDSL